MREMRITLLQMFRVGAVALLALPCLAHAGVPYPNAATPKATDLGSVRAQSGATPISVTVALRLQNISEAEKLLVSIHTPQDPQYHQFLTSQQFVARFAPAETDVAKVVASLASYGLRAERTTATTLKVTGLPADMERAFSVSLHSYSVPARANAEGYTFRAPLSRPTIPTEISATVSAVVGLDTRPNLRPLHVAAPRPLAPAQLPASKAAGDAFGSLTVTDFAKHYDVEPLYHLGVTGNGRTLGIMTFAAFTPSDAFKYWKAIGLTVDSSRIQIVNVDGGPGAPSDASGSIETTLDVEQSGGIAPKAKIIVYQAPNTNQGEADLFAKAIDANVAETLSISWGDWEWYENRENSPITNPVTGKTSGISDAVHELLVRAAIQGQTVFAAAGDGGAYDVNDDLGCNGPYSSSNPSSCSLTLTVDYPASDTAITAAGGTTLAGVQENCLNAKCTPPYYRVDVPHERIWGWDYLDGYCKALGYSNPIACGIFPAGSGGGVSVVFDIPVYQIFTPGMQRSQPGQVFKAGSDYSEDGGLYYALPAHYPGRNVPDISFNADPFTGYVIYYTSDTSGFGIDSGYGGTSFVAPQLNGVSALLGEYLHGRIGLMNFPLYDLAISNRGYGGAKPPLKMIGYGDNWFYHGSNGYNRGAGLGILDVSNFAEILHSLY